MIYMQGKLFAETSQGQSSALHHNCHSFFSVGVVLGEVTFFQTNYLYPFHNLREKKYCIIFLYSQGLYMYVCTVYVFQVFRTYASDQVITSIH